MQILSKIVAPEMTSKQEKKPKLVANLVKAEEKPHDVKPAVNTAGLDDPENTANSCGDIVTMNGRRYRWSSQRGGWVDIENGNFLPAGPVGNPIKLKFMDPAGNYYTFPSAMNYMFRHCMGLFCTAASLQLAAVRFCFDGRRLRGDDTPGMVDMEEGDVIEVYQEQSGGQVSA